MAIETRARTPQPQFGRVMGIAEIRLEKIGGGLGRGGCTDHLGQASWYV